jgi:predicted ATPase
VADVFISYSREDAAEAERLAGALEAAGYSCWWDRNLVSGSRYLAETEAQLKGSKAVVVIWSKVSVNSHWVADEAAVGRDESRLAALSFDDSMPPLGFRQFQVTDFVGWQGRADEASFRNLLAGLERLAPRGVVAGPVAAVPAPPTRGNLPRRLEPLIGREAELSQIGALLAEASLVTLTGPGGIGKTRLAIEAARRSAGDYADGAFLVELASVSDASGIPAAIARALETELRGEDIVLRLRAMRALIVLDNCEHLVEPAASLAERILHAAPEMRVLATSQEVLGLEGERVVRLRSLGEADAEALFLRAARGADPDFTPAPSDGPIIRAICARLDGIALAIEMAAARAPLLGTGKLMSLLDDRFRVLTAGRRTALPRQRTLQATLDWSHNLLKPEEAAVFRRLSVFVGGGTLEAVGAVASDEALTSLAVGEALASLVAKSLVTIDRRKEGLRYRLLETMRAYAQQKLAEADETRSLRQRHATYLAKFYEPWMKIYLQEDFYDRLDFHAEIDNLQAALEWAFGPDGDTALGVILAANGFQIYHLFGRWSEAYHWIELALSGLGPDRGTLYQRLVAGRARTSLLARDGDPASLIAALREVPAGSDMLARSLVLITSFYAQSYSKLFADLGADLELIRLELRQMGWPEDATVLLSLDYADLTSRRVEAPNDHVALRQVTEAYVSKARGLGREFFVPGLLCLGSCEEMPWNEDVDCAIEAAERLLRAALQGNSRFIGLGFGGMAGRLIGELCRRGAPGDRARACDWAERVARHQGLYLPLLLFSLPMLALSDGRPRDAALVLGAVSYGMLAHHREPYLQEVRDLLQQALPTDTYQAALAEGRRLNTREALDLAIGKTRATASR